MTNPDWKKAKELFEVARRLEPNARESFLAKASGDDDALRELLQELLLADQEADLEFESVAALETGDLPPPARSSLNAGERVGPYSIRELLGEGAAPGNSHHVTMVDPEYRQQSSAEPRELPHPARDQRRARPADTR